jgi:hypothetical protein
MTDKHKKEFYETEFHYKQINEDKNLNIVKEAGTYRSYV